MLKLALSSIVFLAFQFAPAEANVPEYDEPLRPYQHVKEQPPADVLEEATSSPGADYIWIRGHWKWDNKWHWLKGSWYRKPHPNAEWVHGHWHKRTYGWVWHTGHWN